VISFILFVLAIKYHNSIKEKIQLNREMANECSRGIDRIDGKWNTFEEMGSEFIDDDHPFSSDLDIFGQASLYQMIQCSSTEPGKKKLADLLSIREPVVEEIRERQDAIVELSKKYLWRIRFTATGRLQKAIGQNPGELAQWAVHGHLKLSFPPLKIMARIAPFAMIFSLAFSIGGLIPLLVPGLLFVLYTLVALPGMKLSSSEFAVTECYRDDIARYKELITLFQNENFQSSFLNKLQKPLRENKGAEDAISKLESLVDLSHMRFSSLHGLVNFLFLWDYNILVSMNNWKKSHGSNLLMWIESVGYCEALTSLSVINHENPQWAVPEFSQSFEAHDLGHPLINENNRVCNDVEIKKDGDVHLITGSNMSGKSTLLRSIALSQVMAYSGSAVCSKKIALKALPVFTSMRINDNLDKNISSFYAEIDRIAGIVKAAEKHKILFFLDEIFRGTNSEDRRTGAQAIIQFLSKKKSTGLVSTHDLELAHLEKRQDIQLYNYHFREKYIDGKIFFDYTLLDGVSTTRDAIYLMKMIGLPIDSDMGD